MTRLESAWLAAFFWAIFGVLAQTAGNYIWEQKHLHLIVSFGEGLIFGVAWLTVFGVAAMLTAYAGRKEDGE